MITLYPPKKGPEVMIVLVISRVGPDMIFLPDAGYPAGLSGMSCRILPDIRFFIAG